jgi:hypothetical protein
MATAMVDLGKIKLELNREREERRREGDGMFLPKA